jgi:hypothetical protein
MCSMAAGRRRWRCGAAALSGLALTLELAGNLAAAEPPPVLEAPAPLPLAVAVRTDWPDVTPEAVRQAVGDELQSWVVLVDPAAPLPDYAPRLRVDVSAARGELVVRYDGPGRKPLVRAITTPASGEATIRTIAWLAGNLVRDQASDLLPAPAPAAPVEPPPAAVAPPPPPVPGHAAVASVTVQVAPVPPGRGYAPVAVSVFFPLATNALDPEVRVHLSANLFYGRIGVLDNGLQLGIANQVTGDARGAQVGVVNQVGGDVDGLQIGVVNQTGGHFFGGQSGLVNRAGDVRGIQLGLINVARNVQGVQVGLINISDDIEGLPIGLINVSASGGVHPVIWTSGTTQVAFGLKFSTRHVYTLFTGATQPSDGLRLWGPGLALGVRFPTGLIVFESDVGGMYLFGGQMQGLSLDAGQREDMALASWRGIVSLQFRPHLALFGGVALTARFKILQTVSYELGPDLFAGVQL